MSQVIDLLRELVAIPSVNPSGGEPDDALYGEARMVAHLEAFLGRHKIDCKRQKACDGRENLIAVVEGRSAQPIILESHTDTVAVEGMEIEPFDPRVEGGKLYGRGACDDKGSLAAMVMALVNVAASGTPADTCILAATCDEEYRFSGVNALVERPEDVGLSVEQLRSGMACAGEPTGLDVVVAHKGAYRWCLRTRGCAAHSSDPTQGENAIYTMSRLVGLLEEYAESLGARPKHPLVQGPTFSVGTIQGGSAVNIVPDLCEVLVDRRLVPGENGEDAGEELREFIGNQVAFEMEVLLEDWPMETPLDAQVVRRVRAAAESATGRGNVVGVQYGTDASKLHRAGIESVVCGPGDIAQAHTANEWVEVAQVEAAVRLYEGILTG